MEKAPQLERSLTLRGAVTLNLLDMIGVGPFLTLPLLLAAMGGPQAMLGWVLGALLAACDGLVWAELGAMMPEAGGTYAYLGQMFPGRWGRWLSFLFVFQLMFSAPLSVASGCIGLAQYAGFLSPALRSSAAVHMLHVGPYSFGVSAGRANWVAITAVVLAVVLLYRRLSAMRGLATAMLALVLLTLGWAMVTGLLHGHIDPVFSFAPGAFRLNHAFFAGLGSAMLITTYDYWGYYNVTFLGGEATEPGRTIPRAVLLSIGIVAVLYLGLNASVLCGDHSGGWEPGRATRVAERVHADSVCANVGSVCGAATGAVGGAAGNGDGVCKRVRAAAGVLADTVCRGEEWELPGGVRTAASDAGVSLYRPVDSGGRGVPVLLLLAERCDCGAGAADRAPVRIAAGGGDGAADSAAGDGEAVPDVAVSVAAAARAAGVWVHRVRAGELWAGVTACGDGCSGGNNCVHASRCINIQCAAGSVN